jgi:subtilisin family serine protease
MTALSVLTLALALSACNTSMPEVEATSAPRFERVMSVNIEPNETVEMLEARINGQVVSWQPDAGYAIVGLDQDAAMTFQKTAFDPTDPNKDAIKLLETRATATASGLNSWSSGWSAWGSGWSAWGSGQATSLAPKENSALWAKIQLAEAHRLAPKWGAGIKVAVIDTGIDLNHPAFRNRLVPANEMWDWVGNDAVPQEVQGGEGYGHGTIVAGIIAQVAQNARIMPLRVLASNGAGDTINVIAAVDWAVAKGARVINLSLGADTLKSLQKAIMNATQAGVLVVASSGNSGDKTVTFPARAFGGGSWAELAVGVGSTDKDDRRSRFSTFGKELEMVAPGEQIYGPVPDNRVASWSGTSMAAPVVSGGLALALGERAYSKLSDVGKAIVNTSDDILASNPGSGKDDFGRGRLNLKTFLQTVLALK